MTLNMTLAAEGLIDDPPYAAAVPEPTPLTAFRGDGRLAFRLVRELRTAIGRACKATGTPLFSPHDLRHRRATLWHLAGVPAATAAAWLGHSAQEHLRTYADAVLDRTELDYASHIGTPTPNAR